jgi:hypothetical protein
MNTRAARARRQLVRWLCTVAATGETGAYTDPSTATASAAVWALRGQTAAIWRAVFTANEAPPVDSHRTFVVHVNGTEKWATPGAVEFVRAFGCPVEDGAGRFFFLDGAELGGMVRPPAGWRLFGLLVAAELVAA